MRRILTPARVDYRNPFMEVRHTSADFGTYSKEYFVVELGPRAGIVPMKDGRVLLTRQYRFLIDATSWELPGGRVDDGETPEIAAVRECIEETGVECRGLRKLVEYFPGLDNFNNRTTLFVSEDTRTVAEFEPVDSEVVEIRWFALDEAMRDGVLGRDSRCHDRRRAACLSGPAALKARLGRRAEHAHPSYARYHQRGRDDPHAPEALFQRERSDERREHDARLPECRDLGDVGQCQGEQGPGRSSSRPASLHRVLHASCRARMSPLGRGARARRASRRTARRAAAARRCTSPVSARRASPIPSITV